MVETNVNRRIQNLLSVLVVTAFSLGWIGLAPRASYAQNSQCTLSSPSLWNVASGNWSAAVNWTPNGVPNSSSTNVCLTNGTSNASAAATALDISVSIANLQVGSFNALDISTGQTLSVVGTAVINSGTITLNGGGGANGFINIENNVTLSGSGTLNMSVASGGGSAFIEQAGGSFTLTNSDNTIQGDGVIGNGGLTLVNQSGGTIDANVSGGTLTLNGSGGVTNEGLLEATSGTLVIQNVVTNAGGNITANGGAVQFQNGSGVAGGTLNTTSGGVMETAPGATATLNGVTISSGSTYTASDNAATVLLGAINNTGTVQLNGGGGANGVLSIDSNVTLTGGGTVTLATSSVAGGGDAFIQEAGGSFTLINSNNTIQGNGVIGNGGLIVVNGTSGIIDATTASGQITTLTLNGSGGVTNQGLLEATGGGILLIANPVANGGGTISAASGGTVELLNGSTVMGGTLTNSGGTIETAAGNSGGIDGSTAAGAVTINGVYTSPTNAATVLLGTIDNNGTIQLNGGGGENGELNVESNVTLSGGGALSMSVASGSGSAFIQQAGGNFTLTNANNTIQGDGVIGNGGLTLVNQSGGTIDANVSGGTLTLNGGGLTNQGLLEATTGTLVIQNVVTNAGGNITANGGAVQFQNGSGVAGGTLNTTSGGVMETAPGATATLNGVTISSGSTYTASDNAATVLLGAINNAGTIQLNGGGGDNGELNVESNVTLSGGGTLNMSVASGSGSAFIQQAGGNFTLTNANNTIQGDGVIGNGGLTVVNQSGEIIDANASGGTLALNGGGGVTNEGLMEATTGTLVIQNSVTNTGGNITANGGTVQFLNGSGVAGGTLNTTSGGVMETVPGAAATLNGVTISSGSTYTASNNATTVLLGAINNAGTIQLNGGGGSNGLLLIENNVTLSGRGTLNMSVASGSGSAFIQQAGGNFTLTNADNTIQGDGVIGNGGLTLVNGGLLLANVAGQTLLVNGSGALTNNGGFAATAGSTLHTQNGAFTNFSFSGSTLTGGAYAADGAIEIDQLGSTGGEIVTNNANIILDGSGGGAALISDAAGKNALSNLATNEGSFTIENGGNANFTTAGNLANSGLVAVGGGTTLALGSVGANALNQSAGTTEGTGTIAGKVNINGGAVQPGTHNAPGTLTINGTTSISGTFAEQIASASNFSVLNVTAGNLTLGSGSLLNISLLGGFNNPVGDSFTIINDPNGAVAGTFSNAPASGFQADGVNWTIAYNANDVVLNGVSLVGSLVTATWNTASGNWTTATEWACSPGPSNCVPNNSGSNTYAAVVNSAGNTLTLNTSETVNTLSLQAGTLDITATGSLSLAAQPNGITDIGAGAGLSLEGSLTNASGSNALANLATIEGSLTLDNGQTTTLAGGLASSGTLTVSGTGTTLTAAGFTNNTGGIFGMDTGSSVQTTGSFSNSGTVSVNGGTLTAAGFTNNTGGIFGMDAGSSVQSNGDFSNAGTLTASGTGADLAVTGTLSNSSQVSIGNGATLTAAGFANNTGGIFGMDAGSTVQTTGSFSNSGTVNANGGTLTAAGFTNNTGGIFGMDTGSTVQTNGSFSNSGTVNANGGSLTAAGFTNNTGGIFGMDAGSSVQSTRDFGNAGTLTISGTGADLAVTGTLSNSFHVSVGNGGTLTAAGFTNNTGGIFGMDSGSTVQTTGEFSNSGTVNANGGTLTAAGFTNNAGGIFGMDAGSSVQSNGDFSNAGTLTVSGTGADLAVTGTLSNSSQVSVGNGGTLTAAGFTNNTGGLFGMNAGSSVQSTGNFSNAGSTTVGGTLTMVNGGVYTQTGGSTTVSDGMLLPAVQLNGGTVNINTGGTIQGTSYTQAAGTTDVDGTLISPTVSISSGLLTGDGSVRGNVSQTGGTLQPGDPPGTLSIIGNLNLSSTTFNEQIAGGTAGTSYSVLAVSGALDFGASDTLIPLDELSFNPSNGETFDIIDAGSITGTFDNNNIAFDGGTFTVNYDTTGCASGSDCVVLTWNKPTGVTPEPASLLLFGTGLLGLAWLVRRRRRVASRG